MRRIFAVLFAFVFLACAGASHTASGQSKNPFDDDKVFRAAAAACQSAYQIGVEEPGTGFLSGPVKLKVFDRHGKWKLSFFVASNDKSMVVAFRGTNYDLPGHQNEAMNAETQKLNGIPLTENPGFGTMMTHPGWADGSGTVIDDLEAAMNEQDARKKNIIITGHSMGGAMAAYVTYRLMNTTDVFNPEIADHRLVTFAAPRYAGAAHGGGFSFKSKFGSLAEKKSLAIYSVEIEGDSKVSAWKDAVPHIRVDRMGTELNLKIAEDKDKHDSKNYYDALVAARYSRERLRIIRVFCHETSESGEDEIYVEVKPGTRYPSSGYYDINEDSGGFSNRLINPDGEAVSFVGDAMTINLWEDDDTGSDDLLGSHVVNRNELGKDVQEVKMTGDDGDYSLFYRVEN